MRFNAFLGRCFVLLLHYWCIVVIVFCWLIRFVPEWLILVSRVFMWREYAYFLFGDLVLLKWWVFLCLSKKKSGECDVQAGNRIIRKRIHVRVEHVMPSRCTEEFRLRKVKNDKLKAEARQRERWYSWKTIAFFNIIVVIGFLITCIENTLSKKKMKLIDDLYV